MVALDDPVQRDIAAADIGAVIRRPPPVLLDEWQRLPALWDAVRRAVDADDRGDAQNPVLEEKPAAPQEGDDGADMEGGRFCGGSALLPPWTSKDAPWTSMSAPWTSLRQRGHHPKRRNCVHARWNCVHGRAMDVPAPLMDVTGGRRDVTEAFMEHPAPDGGGI